MCNRWLSSELFFLLFWLKVSSVIVLKFCSKCIYLYLYILWKVKDQEMFVQSKRSVRAFELSFLPACQHMYLHTSAYPVRADTIDHQRVHALCADRARRAGKHQQPNLPSWNCSTFTNCAIKFSHRWMIHEVPQRFSIPAHILHVSLS